MKKLKAFLLILVSCFLLAGWMAPTYAAAENQGAAAQTAATEQAKVYKVQIIDRAKLLTEEQKQLLYKDMEPLAKYGHVVFYTTTLKKGVNYEKNCESIYYQLHKNDPGVIFQIDMGNRKLTLSASTGMEDRIGHERSSIVDNIYQKATARDYYGCASDCYKQILMVINNEEIAHDMKYIDNAICAVILGLLINFMVMFSTTRNRATKTKLLGEMTAAIALGEVMVKATKSKRYYDPKPKGSSGGGSSWGGGGGGGGGFSGGSSSHGF